MRKMLLTTILIAAALLFTSCDLIHFWPQNGRETDPTLVDASINISCEIDLDIEKIVTKGAAAPVYTDEDADKYLRRFLVEIYEDNQEAGGPVFSNIFTQDVTDKGSLTFKADLHTLKYKAIVWMDYILKESGNDLHYITSEGLSAIKVRPNSSYEACDDFKDAQSVVYPFDLTSQTDWFAHIVIGIPLQRPVAKITFEATDFEEFAKKAGCPQGEYEEFAKDYEIHFTYNGYLPTGFNAVTQKLNDSQTGYAFDSVPVLLEGTPSAEIGFDYIFVNGEQSSVTISVEIRKKDGTVVNRSDNIVIPTFRGKETVVKDKFFTKDYVPGIGINPEFEGEFDVYV